jgi:hypothetical protein
MPAISCSINGVTVDFKSTVNKEVDQNMINGLKACIKTDIASGYTLNSIYISSANDSHTSPSRHVMKKAVDISRINGKKMITYYGNDAEVTEITKAIQIEFENYPKRRENFGPYLKKKLGVAKDISGHNDHIHLSVN